MSKAENGQTVQVHYKGTLSDGTVFDNSRDRGETLEFTLGGGALLPDFENAVVGMETGEVKNFTIAEGYGAPNPEAIVPVPKQAFPEDFEFNVGAVVPGTKGAGQPFQATITEIQDETVTLDHNHPLAGKDLNFEVELVGVS